MSLTHQLFTYLRIYYNIKHRALICNSDFSKKPEITREAKNHFLSFKKRTFKCTLKYLQMKYMSRVGFKIKWIAKGINEKRLAMSCSLLKMSDGNLGVRYTVYLLLYMFKIILNEKNV